MQELNRQSQFSPHGMFRKPGQVLCTSKIGIDMKHRRKNICDDNNDDFEGTPVLAMSQDAEATPSMLLALLHDIALYLLVLVRKGLCHTEVLY